MADTASGKPTEARAVLDLEVEHGADGGPGALSVRGEIDISTSPLVDRIMTAMIDCGAAPLVIDASGVEFIDCSGLRAVLAAADRLRRNGTELVLRSPSNPFLLLLEVSGATDAVRIEPATASPPSRHDGAALGGTTLLRRSR